MSTVSSRFRVAPTVDGIAGIRKRWALMSRGVRVFIAAAAIAGVLLAVMLYPLDRATVLMGLSQFNVGLVLLMTSSLVRPRKED